jgi:hypothetical protein
MHKKRNLRGVGFAGLVLILVAGGVRAENQVRIVHAIKQDTSAPLRDLAAANGREPMSSVPESATRSGNAGGKNPALLLNFAAMGSTGAYLDADPNGAVGATQYVQWTNARYAVYNKTTGMTIVKPTNAKTLWLGFGGTCETTNAGDGIVIYDKAAQRWIISHHSGALPYLQCFAISTTSDASGSYYRYAFQLTTQFPDWPKVGVWPDAYYITMNLMTSHVSVGAEVCALDRTSMLVGSPTAIAQCFTAGSANTDYVLMPADLDGSTPPPAGAPNYLLSLNTNSLDLFTFHVDWVTPANSTLSGPANIPVTPFTEGCNGGFCVPQLGSTQLLDAVGERVMYRLAYRNFSDHESLLATHTVNNSGGTSVGVRWYEIRTPATPVVYQSGTIQPDNNFRSMGSLAMDKAGNILIGYSVSSAAMYPAIAYSGRLSTDPLGTLQAEATLFSGTGAQTGTNDYHWGDYTSMTIDPVDDCTFWYTNEYYKTTGTAWNTRIASFKFSTCQ